MSATEVPPSPGPQLPLRQPRRSLLRSPRAWLMSQPRAQALIYHPKVQWAMTNLGIRRWLAIRRWPPLFIANGLPNMLTDPIHARRWWIDMMAFAVGGTLFVTALGADAYLTRRASRLVGI